MNGLSDHDAQLIILNKIILNPPTKLVKEIRTFDKNSVNDFLNNVSFEIWDTTFSSEDINIMFSAFLDMYLKIFYSSFPKKIIKFTPKRNDWIILDIRNHPDHSPTILYCNLPQPLFFHTGH
jgi:hypothetical protein